MHLCKIFLTTAFAINTVILVASAPAPSPTEPMEMLDLGASMMPMPCIDDRASSSIRGASTNGRSSRREMRLQAAAPLGSFDQITFMSIVQKFDQAGLKDFLQKQPRALVRRHIDKPLDGLSDLQLSALQYVALKGCNSDNCLAVARILLSYGACACGPSFYPGQLKQSPIQIVKQAHYLTLPGIATPSIRFLDTPFSAEQLAVLRVATTDETYCLYELLELFSRPSVDSLVEDFAALATTTSS